MCRSLAVGTKNGYRLFPLNTLDRLEPSFEKGVFNYTSLIPRPSECSCKKTYRVPDWEQGSQHYIIRGLVSFPDPLSLRKGEKQGGEVLFLPFLGEVYH